VNITVWYPAIKPQGFEGTSMENAEPDLTGAPYPLILSTTKNAGFFAPHLVTHGFAAVSVNKLDTYKQWDTNMIDQPLDILFALDQVASTLLEGLQGVLDTEHIGAMGYSYDGYNALAMSGARLDPAFFLSQCADPESEEANIFPYSAEVQCVLMDQWEAFAEHAGDMITTSEDGLWQPMTDERIRAVMPLATDGWLLFGEQGLMAVDGPVLMIVGTNDNGTYQEDTLIYENLGTPDRFLISFVGKDHMMIYNPEMVGRMKHFAVAFFSTYLTGRQEYAEYFSEDFIAQYPDLEWGVFTEN
jgi:predicted dienelactone hydrolase